MNFWTGLILGLIIGWVIEWIIDWLFWRRGREEETARSRAEADALQAEVDRLRQQLTVAERESADWHNQFIELEQNCQGRISELEAVNAQLRADLEARPATVEPVTAAVPLTAELSTAEPSMAEPTMADPSLTMMEETSATRTATFDLDDLPEGAVVVRCPQDLSAVPGIGTVYEQKLYARGVGSFWALSELSDETLADILGVKSFQDVNFEAIRAGAREWAEKTNSVGRVWDGTEPDDFEIFEGIGNVYEGRLYEAGICTYEALAEMTEEQLAEICGASAVRRPNFASWIETARRMVAQRGG